MVDLSDFIKKLESLEKVYVRLPPQIAAVAVNFSKERFREQSWWDTSKKAWTPRKNRRPGGKKRSQTLLVDSGRLMRSIRKISADRQRIIIGTDVPYAEIHNAGGAIKGTVAVKPYTRKAHSRKKHTRTIRGVTQNVKAHSVESYTVGAHTRKVNITIPARPFLGESAELERRIVKLMESAFTEALK